MFVSVLMVRILREECRARGVSDAELLAGCDLSEAQLADIRHRVPSERFAPLVTRALDLTRDDGLGLALGSRLPEQALQVVGYLMGSAPTLRKAYLDFQTYSRLLADNPTSALREEGELAHFELNCPIPALRIERVANDWAVSLAYRIIASCAQGNRGEIRVSVTHGPPPYVESYVRLFGHKVRFDHHCNAVSFPRTWLDEPRIHGDVTTSEALRELADRLLTNLRGATRLTDRARVVMGRNARLDVPGLAQELGFSESGLRRALANEGCSPSQLIDEARCRVACGQLTERVSLKEVASAVGYSEPSSFYRAFKRWTGQSPSEFREHSKASVRAKVADLG